jgi:hypothetical protein
MRSVPQFRLRRAQCDLRNTINTRCRGVERLRRAATVATHPDAWFDTALRMPNPNNIPRNILRTITRTITRTMDRSAFHEATFVWLGSLALSAIFGLIGLVVPFVADNLLALVAATFLYLPAAVLWRRGVDLTAYGLKARPVVRGILLFIVVTLVVMPPFAVGHRYWQKWLFDRDPVIEQDRLARFDRELDDRPTLSPEVLGSSELLVWIESNQLMLLWTGASDSSVTASLSITPREAGADPVQKLRGFKATNDGRLVGSGRGLTRIAGSTTEGHTLHWERRGSGGIGLSLAGIDDFEITANQPIKSGRYRVAVDPPLKQHRSPWWWVLMFATQLILVAIPEEWFYRGYLQQRLDEAMKPRWKVLGVMMGPGWLVSSVMFALGHLVLDARPERLAVFFPSLLFGWMRARTGSILAPSLFHALSNVWIASLNFVYLG